MKEEGYPRIRKHCFCSMRKTKPNVTVIIPTYNRANFLVEAIESVFKQSYPNFELIIIDDGSEDETRERLEPYRDRLRYHYQKNGGISSARNQGLRLAEGEYVAYLDSDDLWKKHKMKTQMDYLEKRPHTQICYTDEIWIRNGNRVNPKKIHRKHSGWIFQHCIPLCIISLSSAIMRKSLFDQVGLFDEELPACEDYDLWLRVSLVAPIHFIPIPLIIKRGGHPDQLSQKYWGMDRFRMRALEKILKKPHLTDNHRELVIRDIVRRCKILAQGSEKRGKMKECEFYIKKKQHYEDLLK